MALYLGSSKVKINLNGVAYDLNLFTTTNISNTVELLTSDGLQLTDSDGLLLSALKENE